MADDGQISLTIKTEKNWVGYSEGKRKVAFA
jgi:hypothetical protein